MDLARRLGAGHPAGSTQITLFVPSVDRFGAPIDQKSLEDEALSVFGTLFRGATAFPSGRGVWRDDERGGALVFDETVMVTSYVDPSLLEEDETVDGLRHFLHTLGRESNQGEVGIVIGGEYLGITTFDQGTGEQVGEDE
jgi:hypothetical protein